MSKWGDIKRQLREERGHMCERCKVSRAVDPHHAIIPRRKGTPELDEKYNLIWLCRDCHKYAGGYEGQRWAWHNNCDRYGYTRMKEWLDSVPMLIKPRF